MRREFLRVDRKIDATHLQKVLLPSISRIINLPTERVVWHIGMMLHAGIRPIFIAQACGFYFST